MKFKLSLILLFQSTLPRREWRQFGKPDPLCDLYFNPHSHAGSDLIGLLAGGINYISIHTPTQGVTMNLRDFIRLAIISIHTPTQGVTTWEQAAARPEIISIHTPTQGVTYKRTGDYAGLSDFNPHSHAGSDLAWKYIIYVQSNFNPHSHAGSDDFLMDRGIKPYNFNPHSHAGSDMGYFREI